MRDKPDAEYQENSKNARHNIFSSIERLQFIYEPTRKPGIEVSGKLNSRGSKTHMILFRSLRTSRIASASRLSKDFRPPT
jgi:hypothetical protein